MASVEENWHTSGDSDIASFTGVFIQNCRCNLKCDPSRLKGLTWPLFNRTLQAYNIEFRTHISPAHILCVLHARSCTRLSRPELSRLGYLELAATLDARTLQHSSKSAWGRLCHSYLGRLGTRINQSDTILFTIRKPVRTWP